MKSSVTCAECSETNAAPECKIQFTVGRRALRLPGLSPEGEALEGEFSRVASSCVLVARFSS